MNNTESVEKSKNKPFLYAGILLLIISAMAWLLFANYGKNHPIKYEVLAKHDGQVESSTYKSRTSYSLVYHVRVQYENGGIRTLEMTDPFVFQSYEIGQNYTIIKPNIDDYSNAGIETPWYCTIWLIIPTFVFGIALIVTFIVVEAIEAEVNRNTF